MTNNPATLVDPSGHFEVHPGWWLLALPFLIVALAILMAGDCDADCERLRQEHGSSAGAPAPGNPCGSVQLGNANVVNACPPAPENPKPGEVGGTRTWQAVAEDQCEVRSPDDPEYLDTHITYLPDETVVIRGGLNTSDNLEERSECIGKRTGWVYGASVNAFPGLSAAELINEAIPHPKLGVTTVGQIRAAGGDVARAYELVTKC